MSRRLDADLGLDSLDLRERIQVLRGAEREARQEIYDNLQRNRTLRSCVQHFRHKIRYYRAAHRSNRSWVPRASWWDASDESWRWIYKNLEAHVYLNAHDKKTYSATVENIGSGEGYALKHGFRTPTQAKRFARRVLLREAVKMAKEKGKKEEK